MAREIPDLLAEVNDLLTSNLVPPGSTNEVTLIQVNAGGQNNILFRAELAGSRETLAVKVCIDRGTDLRNPSSAKKEFEKLQKLHQHARDSDFAVIEPVCLCAERGILVTKWVEGPRLSNYLRSTKVSIRKCIRLCERAGHWLRAFHSADYADDKPLDAREALDDLKKVVANYSSGRTRSPTTAHALLLLERVEPLIAGVPASQRLIHGDFHPGNLLISGDRLIGLDIEESRIGHNLHDLSRWMNHMSHMTLMPKGIVRRPSINKLNRAFVNGYQVGSTSSGDVDDKVLLWLRTIGAVSFFERHRSSGRTRIHDAYFRLVAGRNLRLLCAELSENLR